MNSTRLREVLGAIGWSQRGLADKLEVHETRTRRWARGIGDIPDDVATWLEALAKAHEAHRPPLRHITNTDIIRQPDTVLAVHVAEGEVSRTHPAAKGAAGASE